MTRHFADLSNHNPSFDAVTYARAVKPGKLAPLVALKATEGRTFTDRYVGARSGAAHNRQLAVAYYHFCRPTSGDVEGEAKHFWDVVEPLFSRRHGDVLVLDLEDGDPTTAWIYINAFDRELRRLSGQRPILYTYRSYLQEAGPRLRVSSQRYWIADYGNGSGSQAFAARFAAWWRIGALYGRRAGRILWAHQFTDSGRAPGVSGKCDMNNLRRVSVRYLLKHQRKSGVRR